MTEDAHMNARRASKSGFSLLEITIAIFILAIGISGVLALFPQALRAGSTSIQNNYVTSIAQSVITAVESGLKRDRYPVGTTGWQYFIFQHDGVQDDLPSTKAELKDFNKVYTKDYCVLLPNGATAGVATNDISLLYPAPDPAKRKAMSGKAVTTAWAAADDDQSAKATAVDGSTYFRVLDVYRLGYKGDQLQVQYSSKPDATSPDAEATAADLYARYSFAFFLRRTKEDSDGNLVIDKDDEYSNHLFEIQVNVFRGFRKEIATQDPIPKRNVPVAEFQSIVGF